MVRLEVAYLQEVPAVGGVAHEGIGHLRVDVREHEIDCRGDRQRGSNHLEVETVEVSEAPAEIPGDVGLLVVGGPTHAFGMTRTGTPQEAATETPEPLVWRGIGLREWLESHPSGVCAAVTFDTSFKKARMLGTAGRAAERRLRKLGFDVIARAESFYVGGTTGPLQGTIEQRDELDALQAKGNQRRVLGTASPCTSNIPRGTLLSNPVFHAMTVKSWWASIRHGSGPLWTS